MTTGRREPSDAEILHTVIERRLADVHTHLPGRVKSYANGLAEVEVMVQNADAIPVLSQVPVKFPGSVEGRVKFPIPAGTEVTLVFYQVDPARFRVTGESTQAELARRFGLFAEAWPAPYSDPKRFADADGYTHLGIEGGTDVLVGDGEILLGGPDAAEPVALAALVQAEIQKILDAFATWVPAPVPTDGGAAVAAQLKAAMAAVLLTSPASALVKATE